MSKEEKQTQEPKQTQESASSEKQVVTRYDRRMQRRREEELRRQRDRKIMRVIGIVVLVLFVCLVAFFPIRNFMRVNGTYIEVDGEKITRPEYDYAFSTTFNSYYSNYGYMMYYYMGVDLATADLSATMYDENLTFQDYFDELTVQNLIETHALINDAAEQGFTYDTTAKIDSYMEMLEESATSEGMTFRRYLQACFGDYATQNRVRTYLERDLLASEYYDAVASYLAPDDDEIVAYYEENKDSYDSVDYYMLKVDADLPTEPTDLADIPEEDEDDSSDEGDEDADDEEEEEYEPSEAEIEYAMEQAYIAAQEAIGTVEDEGTYYEEASYSSVGTYYREWVYDEEREPGDTTIVENESGNCYYVVKFMDRYLAEYPTVQARVITTVDDPEPILEEWKAGEATEESFIDLFLKYSNDVISTEGGLYESIYSSGSNRDDELHVWLFDEEHSYGDTAAIVMTSEDEDEDDSTVNYVVFYIGEGKSEWMVDISALLSSEAVEDYLAELTTGVPVNDPHGNLNYFAVLERLAAEEEAAEAEAAAEEEADAETAEEEETAGEDSDTADEAQE